jgi:outer membrane lipoprotein carrier protein
MFDFLKVIALVHGMAMQTQAATPAPPAQPAKPAAAAQPAQPAAQPSKAAPSASDVVAGVQKYYKTTDKLEAVFRQKYTNTVFGKTSVSDGRVFIAKGGKMRWDYKKPDEKYYIADGTTLWVYEKANKQAFQQDMKNELLPVAVTFLYGQGDLAKDFTATMAPGKFGGKNDLCIELTPKQPSGQYKKLWLVVDPSDYHVKESIIEESSGNLNQFTFTKIKLNGKVTFNDKAFVFKVPPGVKVIKPEEAKDQKKAKNP